MACHNAKLGAVIHRSRRSGGRDAARRPNRAHLFCPRSGWRGRQPPHARARGLRGIWTC